MSLWSETEDQQARRTLTGAYTPTPGVCRVCSGKVVAQISFRDDGRIGGPTVQGHVSGWHCQDCKIMYCACPPTVAP